MVSLEHGFFLKLSITLGLLIFCCFGVSAASPSESYSAPPASNLQSTPSENTAFKLNVSDSDSDLQNITFRVNGSLNKTFDTSGSDASVEWEKNFQEKGLYTVKGYASDANSRSLLRTWNISVGTLSVQRKNPRKQIYNTAVNAEESFGVKVFDQKSNLSFVEWYVNGSYKDTSVGLSGSQDTASFTKSFNKTGDYSIDAVVYADGGNRSVKLSKVFEAEVNPNLTLFRETPDSSKAWGEQGEEKNFTANAYDSAGNLSHVNWYATGKTLETTNDISGTNGTTTYALNYSSTGAKEITPVLVTTDGRRYEIPNSTWRLNVQERNYAPDITEISPQEKSFTAGTGYNVNFTANITDGDGDLRKANLTVNETSNVTKLSTANESVIFSKNFTQPGVYKVNLSVTDSDNVTDFFNWTVNVVESNFSIYRSVPEEKNVTVELNDKKGFVVDAHDEEGELSFVSWYVNGLYDTDVIAGEDDSDAVFYNFTSPGNYTVTPAVYADNYERLRDNIQWNVEVVPPEETEAPNMPVKYSELPSPTEQGVVDPVDSGRGLYVWDYAEKLVESDGAKQRFWERAEKYSIEEVYMSWGSLNDANKTKIREFNSEAETRGIDSYATLSAYGYTSIDSNIQTVEKIIGMNNNSVNASQKFKGIHLDFEPKYTDASGTKRFIEDYTDALNNSKTKYTNGSSTLKSENMSLIVTTSHWWPSRTSGELEELMNLDSLDLITIMAYDEDIPRIINKVENIKSLNSTIPIEGAVETDEVPFYSVHKPNIEFSFYEENQKKALNTSQEVAEYYSNSSRWTGTVLHFYAGSLSTWESMRNLQLDKSQIKQGEKVQAEVSMLFDNVFSPAWHNGWIVLKFENGEEKYYQSKAYWDRKPNKIQKTDITWQIPEEAPTGEYEVTATFYDGTFDLRSKDGRHPISFRNSKETPPIPLDSLNTTITVEEKEQEEETESGGGGGSLGIGTTSRETNEETKQKTNKEPKEDELITKSYENSSLGALIEKAVIKAEENTSKKVEISQMNETNSKAYAKLKITASDSINLNLMFKVNKTWLENRGDPRNIQVTHEETQEKIESQLVENRSEKYVYNTTLKEFSIFTIEMPTQTCRKEKCQEEAAKTNKEQNKDKQQSSFLAKVPLKPIAAGIGFFTIIGIAVAGKKIKEEKFRKHIQKQANNIEEELGRKPEELEKTKEKVSTGKYHKALKLTKNFKSRIN